MNSLIKAVLLVIPEKLLSHLFGMWAKIEWPAPIQLFINTTFADMYKINLSEAIKPIDEFKSLSAFFIRHLKPEARPLGEGVIHPCDAFLSVSQPIQSDMLIQNKKINYYINDFLRLNEDDNYIDGHQLTYYLSPQDYHRVHVPMDSELVSVKHISGKLWPVNNWAVKNVDQLFCVNERLVFKFKAASFDYFLVMIGALNVGSINMSIEGTQFYEKDEETIVGKPLLKGEELAYFNMGSSAVLILPKQAGHVLEAENKKTKLGDSIKIG